MFITDNADAAAAFGRMASRGPRPNGDQRSRPFRHRDRLSILRMGIMRGSRTSGYNFNTPAQPGHVFEVTWSGTGPATFVDVSYDLPDLPITASRSTT